MKLSVVTALYQSSEFIREFYENYKIRTGAGCEAFPYLDYD